ncbi:T9SS type B sorting domain-containing protein [Algibacter mikhailovii]|uniref:T9SS type B sorting domain-containing protein n=1 Tax=Algibacter mikhailovii TaxID=425498 RepID=UPI00167BC004|nr:gliding motility-associated C-terminal domain-containing protein [Algibacter mikhailovii]
MRLFLKSHIIVFFVLFVAHFANGQVVIGKPNLEFTQACASPSFNTYNVRFSFSPEELLSSTNQFIIELSDNAGSFSDPEVIFTSEAGSVTSSPATLTFAVPTDISGEAYKLRIKSTAPAATSTSSNAFPAYYKLQDTPFSINNLIGTASYCSGGSYLLTIDNPGAPDNDSPLQYPSLTFKWFRETSPTTADFVAEGPSLSVISSGTYFVETNYGTCTSNSFSNRVTVSEIASGTGSSSITSSLGNPYCINDGPTILRTTNGNSYQWFKDGEEISGATKQTYETNESGTYSVNIDLGSCATSATIDLDTSGFESSLNVLEDNLINDGESLFVEVETTANNPEFTWYLNNIIIAGATSNSYTASEIGEYKVSVAQTEGCLSTTELVFRISTPFPDVAEIPNIISPNGDGINDTWIIPKVYGSGSNTEVLIISSNGKIALRTNDYLNNWPESDLDFKSVNPLFYYVLTTENGQTLKGTITVFK